MMKILPDNSSLVYCGRIDKSNPEAYVWTWPGTFVKLRFCGSRLWVRLRNQREYWDNYLGVIADGVQTKLLLPAQGEAKLEISLSETEDGVHDVMVFKRQDACHELCFLGFELEEGASLLEADPLPSRRIEVYGDSVSAGEVSEALDYVGKADPQDQNGQFSNCWYSYAWITARRLNAQLHDIAQGGIPLLPHTGWYHGPDYMGMEQIWDKQRYNPDFGPVKEWDFSQYTPEVVIVAIGQNDSNPEDYMKTDFEGEKAHNWRTHYRAFLEKLRATYPDAWIVCCTTLLQHDVAWDMSISQVVQDMADQKISHCVFRRNGKATPGHLRIPEAEEMAEELYCHIRNLNVYDDTRVKRSCISCLHENA